MTSKQVPVSLATMTDMRALTNTLSWVFILHFTQASRKVEHVNNLFMKSERLIE